MGGRLFLDALGIGAPPEAFFGRHCRPKNGAPGAEVRKARPGVSGTRTEGNALKTIQDLKNIF